ncbi:putative amidoligase domain-containing protein [Heliophilum fasciatum]|uniref:PhiEco32-like amidoligase-type 2 protein n=1 Tax=Heliophilum fasciatum TaxID=35700 RepID=A0A4R2RML5_9FIRM|nr:hypothetical protein [Heliophilum fasciatum]MCW2279202.1 hypothetical protein [Heliophilum fasciatum]TCP60991.1 phiEco32-like amidoligase-type 2 protein [Heliophilum fasciatum]
MKVYIHFDESAVVAELVRKLNAKGIETIAGRGQPAGAVDAWINWSREPLAPLPGAQRSYNATPWLTDPDDDLRIEQVLQLNRLRALIHDGPRRWPIAVWPKEYQVYIWDTRVVAVQRKVLTMQQQRDLVKGTHLTSSFTWVEHLSNWEQERLVPLALRALHCLGLDFGRVHLAVNRSSGPVILEIDRVPVLRKRLAQAFADTISEALATTGSKEFTIGSDPEFMLALLPGRKMVPASRFFPRVGTVGCDNRRAFGASDDLPLAEIRPQPVSSAEAAVEEIRKALQEANQLCPFRNIVWNAGSEPFPGYPVGGHIHWGGLPLTAQHLRAFDQYLALPLFFLEKSESARRRRNFYGMLGDFRVKSHGFEYRTPGSWLSTPQLTWVALALAQAVALHAKQLTRWDFVDPAFQEAFYDGDRAKLLPSLKTSLAELYAVEPTARMRKLVELIWYMQERGMVADEAIDIRQAWGLTAGHQRYRHVPRLRNQFSWVPNHVMRL